MKIYKFGGTSVGTPERMKEVCQLITEDGEKKIIVLSAMSGTTNSLVEIADYFRKGNPEGAGSVVNALRRTYHEHLPALYSDERILEKTRKLLDEIFLQLNDFRGREFSDADEKVILSKGEIMSTNMVTNYLKEIGVKTYLLPALEYMKLDRNGEPDVAYIREKLDEQLKANPDYDIYITQGFICMNADGQVDNLQRGGSDYTASLIGASIRADEIQIWTDIDGMHNNDPRFVEGTSPVRQLNFEEAAELAYFGAKILHPTCVQPARYAGVPVRLKNTLDPKAPGTLINNDQQEGVIKAVAAKDNITAIKIVSSRMLLASGFMCKVFNVFDKYKTSIDMITTSEVGVSLSIDNTSRLAAIVDELKEVGTVVVDEGMCIICVVGDLRWSNEGFESLAANALRDIPVRMISYGGSDHNISFLIKMEHKKAALKALQEKLFA
ncbi:aspartate kinase [Alloprevotella sp. OH1205_COT-284]|uniref:aspartate kinase n=1 Tax=Alloprevotella sp. OH1205_COT-284 TaxID=2491043 RepID=UPI000F5FCF50|nr:aspartate kinase [Alloprevotella sp. OH1205_COT-284]RRD80680.1 aspartate kinase [Alloprevotella sp. OH1205_COT-284]